MAALAKSVESGIAAIDFKPELIIASFHGMPARTRALGDPYYCQCRPTTRLLAERLERAVRISFQSRFGRAKWLEPATDAVIRELPVGGVRSVAVIPPRLAADCLETMETGSAAGRVKRGTC